MGNIPDSSTIEGFRDITSLSSWKTMAERYAGDEEKPSKVLQMLHTISRDNACTRFSEMMGPDAGFRPQESSRGSKFMTITRRSM